MTDNSKLRATHMLLTDVAVLQSWGDELRYAFPDANGIYHVGSSLNRANYRDVDVRIMLADQDFDDLSRIIDVRRLNLALSLWGQRVTGLPIDCQVQDTTNANFDHQGTRRPLRNPKLALPCTSGSEQ